MPFGSGPFENCTTWRVLKQLRVSSIAYAVSRTANDIGKACHTQCASVVNRSNVARVARLLRCTAAMIN